MSQPAHVPAAVARLRAAPAVTTPVPDRDPPVDDGERHPVSGSQLVLSLFAPPHAEPPQPSARGATVLAFPPEKMLEPPPDITRWAGALMLATVEALNGIRAPGQLRRWYDPRVHAAVAARAARTRVTGAPPRVTLRSARACLVSEGRVEASGVIEVAERFRAVAMRMQTYDGRWRVTALEIG